MGPSLDPLLAAPGVIQAHAFAAMAAFGLGLAQFARIKGTTSHRLMGYVWSALMAFIALTSFFIHAINGPDGFSFIHLISIFVLVMLPVSIMRARRGRISEHRRGMIAMFVGALVIAGAFTFVPGRVMNHVLFGLPPASDSR
jgi:uncharacterized membrane protein